MRQPYDNHSNQRQLLRPMGGDEELARGMARMDPFAGGQFSGNGGRYGMQNQFEPPRPAPNADGWSSGDDCLTWNDQQQHHQQQRQQQQQQQWGIAQPQWNIGASEFVPKSNLSV